MGNFYDHIPDNLMNWIQKQEMFFVATAPIGGKGHVNLSPKGLRGTFHIQSNTRVWYQDLSGSGVETISHIRENGRITIMFCAFEGAARILRLFGTGTVHEFGTPEYSELIPPSERLAGSRAAIVIDVHKVSTTCGYAVPLYTFKSHRTALISWSDKLEERDRKFAADKASCPSEEVHLDDHVEVYPMRSMRHWWATWNVHSLDGLPGLRVAHISDMLPIAGVKPVGTREPPSDGNVVILGNTVPRESGRLLLTVTSREEIVRLVLVFTLGIAVAAMYGRASLGIAVAAMYGRASFPRLGC